MPLFNRFCSNLRTTYVVRHASVSRGRIYFLRILYSFNVFLARNVTKMWHEARKQEKKIRGMMVDYKKRAERRRGYYEKIVSKPMVCLQPRLQQSCSRTNCVQGFSALLA